MPYSVNPARYSSPCRPLNRAAIKWTDTMYYIDPHIHMISRVTDDDHRMALCGCVAISEPAFWAGFDRGSAEGFRDCFRHLTEVEPKRAASRAPSFARGRLH